MNYILQAYGGSHHGSWAYRPAISHANSMALVATELVLTVQLQLGLQAFKEVVMAY